MSLMNISQIWGQNQGTMAMTRFHKHRLASVALSAKDSIREALLITEFKFT